MVGVGQRQYLIGYTDDLEEKADELRAAGFEPMRDGPEQNWGPKVRQISVAGGPPYKLLAESVDEAERKLIDILERKPDDLTITSFPELK